jgi:hypothetical protein
VSASSSPRAAAGDPLVVLHSTGSWLPQTETWLYTQVHFLPGGVENHVACERTENLDQFPQPVVFAQISTCKNVMMMYRCVGAWPVIGG